MPARRTHASLPQQPMAEVFGYRIGDFSAEAERHRKHRLCPFNNKVANCTKVSAKNPLGVCSVYEGESGISITCPIRFRESWRIVDDAAAFFFPADATWTSLTEVRLKNAHGQSAGNIDIVLVAYDAETGRVTDFGSLEVQAVYISGNIRSCFRHYMEDPAGRAGMNWRMHENYPRPDYLSSSRKRLAPQLIYKGGILHAWGRKQAVAVDSRFFSTLPPMESVDQESAELAWFVYDLETDNMTGKYKLAHAKTVYTAFDPALDTITKPEPGSMDQFVRLLQTKLDTKNGKAATPPDARTLAEIVAIEAQGESVPPETGVEEEEDDEGVDDTDYGDDESMEDV